MHLNMDYLVFRDWDTMNSEGVYSGVTSMADATPMRTTEAVRQSRMEDSLTRVQLVYETPAREGMCKTVTFLPVGQKFAKPPTVFITVDHRGDVRTLSHPDYASKHHGLVGWVEQVTETEMVVCYKELARYKQVHGDSINIDWLAIV